MGLSTTVQCCHMATNYKLKYFETFYQIKIIINAIQTLADWLIIVKFKQNVSVSYFVHPELTNSLLPPKSQ